MIEVKSDTEKTGQWDESIRVSVQFVEISSCVVNMLAEFFPWISDLT